MWPSGGEGPWETRRAQGGHDAQQSRNPSPEAPKTDREECNHPETYVCMFTMPSTPQPDNPRSNQLTARGPTIRARLHAQALDHLVVVPSIHLVLGDLAGRDVQGVPPRRLAAVTRRELQHLGEQWTEGLVGWSVGRLARSAEAMTSREE